MALETTIPDLLDSASPASATLAIRWVFPGSSGSITRLETGETLFGREPSCGGCLPSASVSRLHAAIRWVAGSAPMLRDLGSTNGVFLNGRRVRMAPLRPRDVLRIGDFIGIFVALTSASAAAWAFHELSKGYFAGPALLSALEPARALSSTDLPIIIEGETGAGKEGAARAIADWSGRRGPFVAVNCAALPETLAEAELFGYRKGAFSGAQRGHNGFLRAAHGGTLLLDEIADLSLPVQAKLLRALERHELVPLGESEPIAVDLRVLAAAQSPLRRAVEEKRFRPDLLARLDGLTIRLPPLRERVEEVPQLFAKLIELHAPAAAPPRLDPMLIERLCVHDWPFNVRELTLLVRRLLALHPGASALDRSMLSSGFGTAASATQPAGPDPPLDPSPDEERAAGARKRSADRPDPDAAALLAALRAERGNVKRASAALGISRGRLYRLMGKVDSLDLDGLRGPNQE